MANRQEDCEQQGDTQCLAEARCIAKADQQSPAGRCGYCFVRPAPDGGNMGYDWQWEELTKRKVGELLGERLAKGRAQYGKLDPNKKQSREWLQELIEELLDGFVYAYMLATKLGMYQPDPPEGEQMKQSELKTALRKSDAFGHEMASRWHAAERRAEAAEKRVAELERARDDWKARRDQVFAEADQKIVSLRNVVDEARAESAAMLGTLRSLIATIDRDGGQSQSREHVLVSAARAQSQVSEMLVDMDTLRRDAVQLEAALADCTSRLDHAHAAGIREGLERAAVECERDDLVGHAQRIRAMKEQVK